MKKSEIEQLFIGATITDITFTKTVFGINIDEVYVTLTDGTETSLYGTDVESIGAMGINDIEEDE